jgi:hypothetical protein
MERAQKGRRVARTESEDDAQERETLKAFVESDGYKLFLRLVEQEWGADATLAKIDAALRDVARGDEPAVNDTVQQIQAARREVMRAVALPHARLRQVGAPKLPDRMFGSLRRTHR